MLIPISDNKTWVSELTWCCILTLAKTYFKQGTLDIYTDIDVKPLTSTGLWQVYVSNISHRTTSWRKVNVDSIFISQNLEEFEQLGRRGLSLVVTRNLTSSLSLWSMHKLADTVVITDNKAYTWYPYHPEQCNNTPILEKIDECSQCVWSKNLYPSKIPKSFKGCVVTYLVSEWPAYVIENADGTVRGLDTKMMNTVGDYFGLIPNITCHDYLDFYNSGIERLPGTAMLSAHRGKADFIYGSSTLQHIFLDFFDPLSIFREAAATFIFPAAQPKPRFSAIYSGFSNLILTLIVLVLLCSGLTTFLACRLRGIPWNWIDIVSCFTVGPIKNFPSAWTLRIFFALLYLYSQHMAWFYQATLLKNLFHIPMEKQITNLRDAVDEGLTIMMHPFLEPSVDAQDSKILDELMANGRYVLTDDLNSDLVLQRKAFILAVPTDIDRIWKNYSKYIVEKYFYLHNKPYMTTTNLPYGQRDAILTKLFEKKLCQLEESGIIAFWKHIDPELAYLRRMEVSEERKTLDLEMLQGAFYLYCLFIMFGVLILLCEII